MTEDDVGDKPRRGLIATGWRKVREAGTAQLGVTVLLVLVALFIARFSWTLPGGEEPTPLTDAAERALYDMRAWLAADLVEQDERIVLVVYDDQALINLEQRSPLPRDALAEALRNLDTMGAWAIGIDILFDQPQPDDAELIETLRSMQTPVAVGYANVATNAADIVYEQQVFLEQFMAALENSNARPASIRLDEQFGATRVWPDIIPELPPLLGRALLEWPAKKLVPLLALLAALFVGIPFWLHFNDVDTYGLPAAGWIIACTAVTSAARSAWAAQRSFAQGALGKYIPHGARSWGRDRQIRRRCGGRFLGCTDREARRCGACGPGGIRNLAGRRAIPARSRSDGPGAASDRQDPRRPAFRGSGDRQFRRRHPHPVHGTR